VLRGPASASRRVRVHSGSPAGPSPGERGHIVDDDARAETRDTWEEWFNANVIAQ